MRMNPASASVILVLGSCVSLQIGAAIATPLLAQFGPGLTTTLRLLIAGLLLALIYRPKVTRYTQREWIAVLAFGIALAGMNGFFYAAIARIPLGFAVTIEFAGPLLLAALLSRRWRDLGCVVAAAAAILVLCFSRSGNALQQLDRRGVVFALVAAFFWALYILAGKNLSRQMSGHGALSAGMLVGALAITPFGVGALPALVVDPDKLLGLLAVALLSSMIPYTLEFSAMRHLSPQTFGVLLSLEPAVAGVAGWMLLDQSLTWVQALAMTTVVAASVAAILGQNARGREPVRATDEAEISATPTLSPA